MTTKAASLDGEFPSPVANQNLSLVPSRNDASRNLASAFSIEDFLNRHYPRRTRRKYRAGNSIFSQGDPANSVFYILEGKVNLTIVSRLGKEAIVAHLEQGNYFAEASLVGVSHHTYSAEALETSEVIRIDKKGMLSLLENEPKFSEHFREHLLFRNIRLQADLVDHQFNSSEKRLARLLMLMANFGQESKPDPVVVDISQGSLAKMIGTTRSRVSLFLNRFRDLGYIDYDSTGMRINSSLISIVLRD